MGIEEAFKAMPRRNFLPPEIQEEAEWDMALPIGYGQTNSQPSTVRLMLQWLDVEPGQNVLDVGSGSGWTSSLLSHLTGEKGGVVAVEKVPELVKFGRENCRRSGCKNVDFHEAAKAFGWPQDAPYDRILVSASAEELPQELVDQLKPRGRMVVPVGENIFVVDKPLTGDIKIEEQPGFVFVPLL